MGDYPGGSGLVRWLAGLGVGLVQVVDAQEFAWAGPWIARVCSSDGGVRGAAVMFGVPAGGVAWDPSGVTREPGWRIVDGFVLSAFDVAQAMPSRPEVGATGGVVEALWIAQAAGEAFQRREAVHAVAGAGLEGDRHALGTGTFSSGVPGSALTLIEAEVCESFDPVLSADEHRRNVVTRGIDLNGLVGREFTIGGIRCRGMRLCEPCIVIERYATRPLLRQLVHRGGLRADILDDGTITVADPVKPS